MKKIIKLISENTQFLFVLSIIFLMIYACIDNENKVMIDHKKSCETNDKYFSGTFKLRKIGMQTSTETTSDSKGSFFLFMGSYSSSSKSQTINKVRICFLNFRNEYEFKEFDIDNCTIKIDNSIDVPYIKFRYNKDLSPYYYGGSYENRSKSVVSGIIIHRKDSDFKPNININTLN